MGCTGWIERESEEMKTYYNELVFECKRRSNENWNSMIIDSGLTTRM